MGGRERVNLDEQFPDFGGKAIQLFAAELSYEQTGYRHIALPGEQFTSMLSSMTTS
jgi:hypothetical protein